MGLYRRETSPYWWICYMRDGVQKHESTKTNDRAQAEQLYRDRAAGIGEKPRSHRKPGPNTGVYFLKSETTGLVKIGCGLDVYKRIEIIRSNSADDLTLLAVSRHKDHRLHELVTQKKFWDRHVKREWFRLTEAEVAAHLKEIRSV